MGTKGYLIDTNAGIDYLAEVMPEKGLAFLDTIIDNGYSISVISRIELYAYSKLTEQDKESLDLMTAQASVLNINDAIIEKTIEIRRTYKTKLPDAIIAATALVYGLALITRNLKDFKNITGLEVANPHAS
jgi:predicted nucleic acid-binding protein